MSISDLLKIKNYGLEIYRYDTFRHLFKIYQKLKMEEKIAIIFSFSQDTTFIVFH